MTNDIVAFDHNALKKRIAESVQSQFGMLIPADQFDKMVATEVAAYFEIETPFMIASEPISSDWGAQRVQLTKATMTPFRRQCWEEVAKLTKNIIDKHLQSDVFKAIVNQTSDSNVIEVELSDMLSKKLDALAPKMAVSLFKQLFVEAVSESRAVISEELNRRLR